MQAQRDLQSSVLPLDPYAVILPMAALLQHLENSPVPVDAGTYLSIQSDLSEHLVRAGMNDKIDRILKAFPAAAELYENLHYDQAGLCRSPLDSAVRAEKQARSAIQACAKAD